MPLPCQPPKCLLNVGNHDENRRNDNPPSGPEVRKSEIRPRPKFALTREPAPGTGLAKRVFMGFAIATAHPSSPRNSAPRRRNTGLHRPADILGRIPAKRTGPAPDWSGAESPCRRMLRRFQRESPMAYPVGGTSRCARCRCPRAATSILGREPGVDLKVPDR